MAITRDSRLTLTVSIQPVDQYTRQPLGPAFVDLRQRIAVNTTDTFSTVGVTNWPSLSRELYEVGGRWWAIADTSNVVDPFVELPVATTVRAPSIERLLFDVLRL